MEPHTGFLDVSIPVDVHVAGRIERPSSAVFEDASRHLVITGGKKQDKDPFYDQLSAAMSLLPKKTAFIFVHGYNSTFDQAAFRTAQIAYDIGTDVALSAFYSWPSRGGRTPYVEDENNAEWAAPKLQLFLRDFATSSKADRIVLIAHSMGSRTASRALAGLIHTEPTTAAKYSQLILAAPDIDADVFRDQIAPVFSQAKLPVTIYASDKDVPLRLSRFAHGDYHRLGSAGEELFIHPPIETIDASAVDTDWLAHAYFSSTGLLLQDIKALVSEGLSPVERKLKAAGVGTKSYWMFPRDP